MAGRPAHIPTEQTKRLVWEFVAFGLPLGHMANRLGICEDTLQVHYKYELANGLSDMIQTVANKLYHKAIEENDLGAQIFILKTRGRWREKDPDDTKKFESLIEKLVDKIAER